MNVQIYYPIDVDISEFKVSQSLLCSKRALLSFLCLLKLNWTFCGLEY